MIKSDCGRCGKDDGLKVKNGCGGYLSDGSKAPTEAPYRLFRLDIGSEINEYYNCPNKFIPPSIADWWNRYSFWKEFPNSPMPSIDDLQKRFLDARSYYLSELHSFEELKNGSKQRS